MGGDDQAYAVAAGADSGHCRCSHLAGIGARDTAGRSPESGGVCLANVVAAQGDTQPRRCSRRRLTCRNRCDEREAHRQPARSGRLSAGAQACAASRTLRSWKMRRSSRCLDGNLRQGAQAPDQLCQNEQAKKLKRLMTQLRSFVHSLRYLRGEVRPVLMLLQAAVPGPLFKRDFPPSLYRVTRRR